MLAAHNSPIDVAANTEARCWQLTAAQLMLLLTRRHDVGSSQQPVDVAANTEARCWQLTAAQLMARAFSAHLYYSNVRVCA